MRLRKEEQRKWLLKYIIRNVGKGRKLLLKRLPRINEDGNIIETYVDKVNIETALAEYNKQHYKKVLSEKIYHNKVYKEIVNDQFRDKVLNGTVTREDCDSGKVYNFLKLLKSIPRAESYFEPITKDE